MGTDSRRSGGAGRTSRSPSWSGRGWRSSPATGAAGGWARSTWWRWTGRTAVPTVVVCEVKCRSGLGFGHPLEAITWAKLRTLRQLAAEWVRDHPTGPVRVRIDAIGVVLLTGQEPQLTHARGVG